MPVIALRPAQVIALLVVCLLVGAIIWSRWEVGSLRTRLVDCQQAAATDRLQTGQLEAERGQLLAELESQNQAVEHWQQEAAAQAQAVAAAERRATQVRGRVAARVAALQQAPVPAGCDDAVRWAAAQAAAIVTAWEGGQ